jgi:hypothetical protein
MIVHACAQVSVIPRSQYTIPEGCRVQPGSRSSLRKKEFPPRVLLREQAAEDMAQFLKSANVAEPAAAPSSAPAADDGPVS